MKKTLIALAVASSAILSGSAFAWDASGIGGNIDFSGTVTPEAVKNPWEVKLSSAVDMGNVTAKPNEKAFIFKIPNKGLLGIRTVSKTAFAGNTGITPQIKINNIDNVASIDKGGAGILTISLDAKNNTGEKIGTFTFRSRVGAEASVAKNGTSTPYTLYASKAGDAFYGGLKTSTSASEYPRRYAEQFDTEYTQNYDEQNTTGQALQKSSMVFNDAEATYSAYYYLGIDSNSEAQLELINPVNTDTVTWSASMPVTISYQ